MRVELMDLSKHADSVSKNYKRLSRTQIRLLSSQVPESFVAKFADEKSSFGSDTTQLSRHAINRRPTGFSTSYTKPLLLQELD
jgi:hypothetical protein